MINSETNFYYKSDVVRDLFGAWSLQESLLQQYRSMAITLLGLLSASILVLISIGIDHWKDIEEARIARNTELTYMAWFLLALYGTMIILGIYGSYQFHEICLSRQCVVTMFQKLILAEEANRLESLCQTHEIVYPPPALTLRRYATGDPGRELVKNELDYRDRVISFFDDLGMAREGRQNDNHHHRTREFMSGFIFYTFDVFFAISGAIFLLFLFRIIGVI